MKGWEGWINTGLKSKIRIGDQGVVAVVPAADFAAVETVAEQLETAVIPEDLGEGEAGSYALGGLARERDPDVAAEAAAFL